MKLRMFNGRSVLTADATPTSPARVIGGAGGDGDTFLANGYVQTRKSVADGGKAMNRNGWRFANEALPKIAASFAGKPFITGHDWGDVRARGGTIREATVQEPADGELLLLYEIEPQASWAVEGLANGTIDRFSLGVVTSGAIICTVHQTEVFESCYCLPGELVTAKRDGQEVELTAEWEFQDGEGVELSAVNVPAVEGTGIVDAAATGDRRALLAELSALCGRKHPDLVTPTALHLDAEVVALKARLERQPPPASDPVPPIAAAVTFAAELARSLGLPADSTPEQLQTHVAALQASGARVAELEREGLAMHVDVALDRLLLEYSIAADVLADLRATASSSGRAAFDEQLALVQRIAPKGMQAPRIRGSLQSDAGAAISPGESGDGDGNDAYEATRHNPHMPALMRTCRVTAADVRKHGARQFTVLPNLQELAAATDARGDAMGVPRGPKR